MINITPTFLHEYYNTSRGIPDDIDTNINHPVIKIDGKKATAIYQDKKFFPNPVFPVELCEYRRGSNIKLSIDGVIASKFAENNLQKKIYRETADGTKNMKVKVTKFIDLCRQYMKNDLEQELDDEIKLFESTEEAADKRTLEYHYDLWETVKTFNDYLCIVFLNLANILTYPNETFYVKYLNKQIRIKPDEALHMANKICKRMQDEFTDIIYENFPIRGTAERISKVQNLRLMFSIRMKLYPKKNLRLNPRSKRRNERMFNLPIS